MKTVRVLNVDIHNWTFDSFLDQLTEGVVITPNVDHLVKLQKDREFYECYIRSEHIVCDSRIIYFISRFLHPGNGILEQIAGSDLFPAYCQYHKDNTDQVRILLLGGTESSIRTTREVINERAGHEIIVEAYSPPFGFEDSKEELEKIIGLASECRATAVAIGVGSPKQENWIFRHRDAMPGVKLFFCVGATMKFQAGIETRAPRWMTRAGLEWLYRIKQEPRRMIRRYLIDDLPFLWLIAKQKVGLYRNHWE